MKASSRMKNLTDEKVIELVNTNIELRKSLIENCGDWSYPGFEGSILIYSPSDFIRISKLLNIPFNIRPLSDDSNFKYEAVFDYNGFSLSTYVCEKGDLLEDE
jgi:hypothetical protein